MKNLLKTILLGATLAAVALMPASSFAAEKDVKGKKTAEKAVETKSVKKAADVKATGASDKEIADAKAKGLVWVNTDSKIYHKDGAHYGKTKEGKFMSEADAQKAGFRAAKTGGAAAKKEELKDVKTKAAKKK